MTIGLNLKTSNLVWLAILPVNMAFPASPMNVDDAGILDAQYCQVEAWADRFSKANALWISPSCHVGGNWELGIELGHNQSDFDDHNKSLFVGLSTKTQLISKPNWSLALSAAASFNDEIRNDQAIYSLVAPITYNLIHKQIDLHLNFGVEHDQTEANTYSLWGIGFEHHFTELARAYIESYGNSERGRFEERSYQLGAAFDVSNALQLDISYGNSLINQDRYTNYVRVGLVYQTANWLK